LEKTVTATILQLQKKQETQFLCSACGAERSCNCNAPAIPKVQQATEALNAYPGKSDRAIAKEIGASPTTVGKAREELSSGGQLNELRVGRDGKARKRPTKRMPEPDFRPDEEIPVPVKKYIKVLKRMHKLEEANKELFEALQAKEIGATAAAATTNTPTGESVDQSLEERWQYSLANLCGDIIAIAPYWQKQFPGWEKFDCPSHVQKLLEEAATALASITTGTTTTHEAFDTHILELLRLIKGHRPRHFAETAVPQPLLGDLAHFIRELVSVRKLAADTDGPTVSAEYAQSGGAQP
jgi:hypothetical protein